MDLINIGSTGFAQVGREGYHEKMRAEREVLLSYFNEHHPIPEGIRGMCRYKWKSFPHDFGTYHELCLVYDDKVTDYWDEVPTDENQIKSFSFWVFVHELEAVDLESDGILFLCREKYKSNTGEQ